MWVQDPVLPGPDHLRLPQCHGWSSRWTQSGVWCVYVKTGRSAEAGDCQLREQCHVMSRWAQVPPPTGWRTLLADRAEPLLPGPVQWSQRVRTTHEQVINSWTSVSSKKFPLNKTDHIPQLHSTVKKLNWQSLQPDKTHKYLIPVIICFHSAVGIDGQVVSEIILTVVRWLHPSTEEQDCLWTGIRPRQNTLLVHTTQHLHTHKTLAIHKHKWTNKSGDRCFCF